jgi:fructokinase
MRVVVAGESLVDLVPDGVGGHRALPGGSPFNVAVGLGRLGVPTGLLGPISVDEHGTLLADRLAHAGVRILPAARTARPTTLATVTLDDAGRASYTFTLDGTSATGMGPDDLATAVAEVPGTASAALHVSLGAVTLASPGTGALLAGMVADAAARPFVSLDPNVRPAVMQDMDAERAAIARAVADGRPREGQRRRSPRAASGPGSAGGRRGLGALGTCAGRRDARR